jgi:electron transfer flavoprotein beta subunit
LTLSPGLTLTSCTVPLTLDGCDSSHHLVDLLQESDGVGIDDRGRAEVTLDPAARTVTARRDGDAETVVVQAPLPAVVSVTDQINEPRYPSFKGIMAAKKKPVQTWGLTDLGMQPDQVGLAAAWTTVLQVDARPPRTQGEVVADAGDGGLKLAEFLTSRKFV